MGGVWGDSRCGEDGADAVNPNDGVAGTTSLKVGRAEVGFEVADCTVNTSSAAGRI